MYNIHTYIYDALRNSKFVTNQTAAFSLPVKFSLLIGWFPLAIFTENGKKFIPMNDIKK